MFLTDKSLVIETDGISSVSLSTTLIDRANGGVACQHMSEDVITQRQELSRAILDLIAANKGMLFDQLILALLKKKTWGSNVPSRNDVYYAVRRLQCEGEINSMDGYVSIK